MDELKEYIESLESNLISVINELKASTEIILKELTLYLSTSARDIGEIRSTINDNESLLKSFKVYINKLESIEEKISNAPREIAEIDRKITESIESSKQNQHKYYTATTNNLKALNKAISERLSRGINETKSQMESNNNKVNELSGNVKYLSSALKDYKEELNRSQERLVLIIKELIKNQGDIEKVDLEIRKEDIELRKAEVTSTTDVKKEKIKFWTKIAGYVLGSGGILFLILNFLFNLIGG
jgi:chromosome segregation ATPase